MHLREIEAAANDVYSQLQALKAEPDVIQVEGMKSPRQERIEYLEATLAALGLAASLHRKR